MANLPKVTIGIISFNDLKYLQQNLPEFKKLDYPDYKILCVDNNPHQDIQNWITINHPEVKVYRFGENLGFGRSHNYMIHQTPGEFYLAFNSDMFPEKNFLKELIKTITRDQKIAAVSGKLLQWRNFPEKPNPNNPQYIDTTGLVIMKKHKVFDRGQSEEDRGQYENIEEEIWGTSGAAPLFRISALKDIAHSPGEYFDKDFFLYKEDVDLAYRLRWAGWKSIYNPKAIAWHDRTTKSMGNIIQNIQKRKERSIVVREQSFRNQFLLVFKNWSNQYSLITKIKTWLFHFEYFLYVLVFDRKLFNQVQNIIKMKPIMLQKSKNMPRRISASEMEKWFH